MGKHTLFIAVIMSIFLSVQEAAADVIFLKNCRTIEGFVSSEDEQCVEVNIGFGIVKFRWSEVERVDKAGPEEAQALRDKWKKKQLRDEEERKKREAEPVPLIVTRERGHIIVNALLNKKVSVFLLMDTGATYVVLSGKIWKKLKIEKPASPDNIVQLTLGDGRNVKARLEKLDALSVQGVEARGVEVVILLEEADVGGNYDGVLGMSFLNRFNFKVDQNEGTLTLEKLK